eukprot:gene32195-16740_t
MFTGTWYSINSNPHPTGTVVPVQPRAPGPAEDVNIRQEFDEQVEMIPDSSYGHLKNFLDRRRPTFLFQQHSKEVFAAVSKIHVPAAAGGLSREQRRRFRDSVKREILQMAWQNGPADPKIGEKAIHFDLVYSWGEKLEVDIVIDNHLFGKEKFKDKPDLQRSVILLKYLYDTLPLPKIKGIHLEGIALLAADDLCRFNVHDPRAVMLAPLVLLASCTSSWQLNRSLAGLAAPPSIKDGELEQWRNRCKVVLKRLSQSRIQSEGDVELVLHPGYSGVLRWTGNDESVLHPGYSCGPVCRNDDATGKMPLASKW